MLDSASSLRSAPAAPQPLAPRGPRRATPAAPAARRRGPAGDGALLDADADLVRAARRRIGRQPPAEPAAPPAAAAGAAAAAAGKVVIDPSADVVTKLRAVWSIFFPAAPRALSPKDEGKQRLRMILVADRCGMSNDALAGMRESIVRAMRDYVEVDGDEAVEVNLSMDPEIGTIYSVAVPVRRVKPTKRAALAGDVGLFDPADPDADPADQFPFGT